MKRRLSSLLERLENVVVEAVSGVSLVATVVTLTSCCCPCTYINVRLHHSDSGYVTYACLALHTHIMSIVRLVPFNDTRGQKVDVATTRRSYAAETVNTLLK